MTVIFVLIAYATAVFLLVVIPFRSASAARTFGIVLAGLLLVVSYVIGIAWNVDASVTVSRVQVPLPMLVVLIFSIVLIAGRESKATHVSGVVAYVLLFGFALIKSHDVVNPIVSSQVDTGLRLAMLTTLVPSFVVSGMTSLTIIAGTGRQVLRSCFTTRLTSDHQHLRVVVRSVVLYGAFLVVVALIGDNGLSARSVSFNGALIVRVMVDLLFFALVDQVVFILIPAATILHHLGLAVSNWPSVAILAVLFAVGSSPSSIGAVLLALTPGLVFAYLYARTSSLVYGIILQTGTMVLLR